jgi:hypothetical protein
MNRRILLIVDFSCDGIYSGNRIYLLNFLKLLKSLGYFLHVHIIYASKPKKISEEFNGLADFSFEYQLFNHIKRSFTSRFILPFVDNIPLWLWATSKCSLKFVDNYDTILVNYIWNYRSIQKCKGKKYLFAHDCFVNRNRLTGAKWLSFSRKSVVTAYRTFDKIIYSNYKEFLQESDYSPNIEFIGLPFKTNSTVRCASDTKNLGFIGSDNYLNERTVKFLFDKLIAHDFKYKYFFIAGRVCNVLTTISLPRNILLLGEISNIEEFYKKVDVVFSIKGSSTGVKIKELEAMSFGKLVVCDVDSLACFPVIDGVKPPLILYDDFFDNAVYEIGNSTSYFVNYNTRIIKDVTRIFYFDSN